MSRLRYLLQVTHEAAAGAEGEALDSYVVVDRDHCYGRCDR